MLRIYPVIIEFVGLVAPIIASIERHDRDLASQMRRAASSIALNTAEATRSQGRNAKARFHTAAGSACEVRACLDVAVALGYIAGVDESLRRKLEQIIGTLVRLTQRR